MIAMLALLQLCLQVNRGVLPEVGDFARIYFQTGFRSIWMSLSGSERLFVLFLFGVAVYTVWLSIFALGRVRNLKKKTAGVEAAASNSVVKNLRNRLRNHVLSIVVGWSRKSAQGLQYSWRVQNDSLWCDPQPTDRFLLPLPTRCLFFAPPALHPVVRIGTIR
jgi:hypothetical protein